jgi:hypothetical protein
MFKMSKVPKVVNAESCCDREHYIVSIFLAIHCAEYWNLKFLTAHSLHLFEAQRTPSFNSFFLSAERAERKKQHPFGKFSLLEFIGVLIYDLWAGNY